MRTTRRVQICLGLLAPLAAAVLPLGGWGRAYSGLGDLWGGEIFFWTITVLLLLYVAVVERQPFSSIGFRAPGVVDLGLGVVAGMLCAVGIVLVFVLVFPLFHFQVNASVMKRILGAPFLFRAMLVTRAAVTEEVLFRGYGIERLQELTGSRWIAAVLTFVAFTGAHLSGWGAPQLLAVAPAALILTALYLWRRNLWANILAHWIADGIGFLLPHG